MGTRPHPGLLTGRNQPGEKRTGESPRKFAFVFLPDYSLSGFANFIEPLRAANQLRSEPLYAWQFYTAGASEAEASCGLEVAARTDVWTIPSQTTVVLCGGVSSDQVTDPHFLATLRRVVKGGGHIVALGDAAFVLHRAGLAEGRDIVVHWSMANRFAEAAPDARLRNLAYVTDGPVTTSAGGHSAFALALDWIEADHGQELSNEISFYLLMDQDDAFKVEMRNLFVLSAKRKNPHLDQCIAVMQDNLEEPLSLEELAETIGLSARHLQRVMLRNTGFAPMQVYRLLRLNRARELLQATSMPVAQVSTACGFQSQSNFARAYRERFGRTPRGDRSRPTRLLNVARTPAGDT